VASVLFVATVVLVVISAVAYLAGKASSPKNVEIAAAAQPVPMLQATITKAPAPTVDPKPASVPEPPIFAEPVNGAVYLQMGAVEKGIALIFTEGLRKRGFPAFAAPGPNEKIFRVLIGPIPGPEAYRRTKEAVDEIGLSTFARKYQQ